MDLAIIKYLEALQQVITGKSSLGFQAGLYLIDILGALWNEEPGLYQFPQYGQDLRQSLLWIEFMVEAVSRNSLDEREGFSEVFEKVRSR